MTAYYCTYFDHRYLSRGLALIQSLRRHSHPFHLWVLALSEECFAALSALEAEDVTPLLLADLEAHDPALLLTRPTRSAVEYYLTCTAPLMTWLLARHGEIDVLTYLDSDLYFFAPPAPIFEEFEGSSILVIPHRFSGQNAHLRRCGLYNVGWISFRRTADGLACLDWWRRSCLDWCYDRIEADRYADQKYLDFFAGMFAGVHILQHPGANLAPWNLDRFRLEQDAEGRLTVDGMPLLFFHFHGLRRVTRFLWRTSHGEYKTALTPLMRRALYAPYLAALDLTGGETKAVPLARMRGAIGATLTSKLRETVLALFRRNGIWVLGRSVF